MATCVIAWCLAVGPPAFAQQYPFLQVPGAPKNITTLFQDSKGRLWVGAIDQLVCFDGARFLSLNSAGLPAAYVHMVTEDSSGALWIGTQRGLYRFSDGHVEQVGKGLVTGVVAALPDIVVASVGPLGAIASTNSSLVRAERTGKTWKTETILDLDSPGPVLLDHTGMLLYAQPARGWSEVRLDDVIHWRPGTNLRVISHPISGFPTSGPMQALRDRFGCVWLGAKSSSDYDCGPGQRAALPRGTPVNSNSHEGPDGTMVLSGFSVLAVGRPGSFRVAKPINGLPGMVDALLARDGTIWIGGPQGLYRFASPFRLEYWTVHEGVRDTPWAVTRSGGRVYAGLGAALGVLGNDRLQWHPIASFPGIDLMSGLVAAQDGTLVATFSGGGAALLTRDGAVLARTRGKPGPLMRLAKTPDGTIWVGGGGSLGRLIRHGDVLEVDHHELQTQPAHNVLSVKYEEHTRKRWACYSGGAVFRNDDGTWKEISTRDGLLSNDCWSLAPLPNGKVWYAYLATRALALLTPLAGGRFDIRQYQASDRMPDPASDTLDLDRAGRLWRGANLAVYVADQVGAEAGTWLKLDQSDGLPANGMNSGGVFADDDGSMWWGADNDIAHFLPPPDLVAPQTAPQVFLSAFSWDGGMPRMAEAVTGLPHGSKVVAHIGSLQFDRRSALRIRYRILPQQPDWRESGSLDLPFDSLSAGSHTLEVQARLFTGPWSATISRPFLVLRPVWFTLPLLAVYFTAAVSLATGGYLLRRRRKEIEAQLLPDLAAWRLDALLPEVHGLEGALLDSRFEVGDLLARGGFANVLAGYDHRQKQRCAIKIFRTEVKDKAWVQRSFDQEVAALQKVRHSNVVSIYAHGKTPSGGPYLVMEFIEGPSLREILEHGALSPRRAARFLGQLAGALDAIHARDIWHRDVKPENVIVRAEGSRAEEAVLIDFSIAIVKDASETLHGLSRAAGSFDYMAPEQAIGYAEPSSDVYSLAKLAIEMLTGSRLSSLLPAASLDLPARVRELLRRLELPLSEDAIAMLALALEFDPMRRPRAAGVFARPIVSDLESAPQTRERG
jgi:tRNA A-37 threonylcarbamoyl transferase component Bud32